MQIEFLGAAQTVTGSKHLVSTEKGSRVLLDCGLYQGRRQESIERNTSLGVDAATLDAVVLSHAHIDHSGALPALAKRGYRGPIYATPATRDLCAAMLMDAAKLQISDARYINHKIEREGAAMDPVTPLYDEADVLRAIAQFVCIPYHRRQPIAPDVAITFHDAGHVLGSAITALDVDDPAASTRLVYTGDLGRKHIPILRDPEVVAGAHALLMESTYGDRTHPRYEDMKGALSAVVKRVHARGGKVIIPSFALERAQEIVFALKALRRSGELPRMPVYVDSPLTVQLTDVFKLHPECYDEETRALVQSHDPPFDFPELRYVSATEGSIAIDASSEPSIVIAASGMCEGGRVLHHLRRGVEDERNCILIVGYQAQHTLGRRIAERRPRVRIFGIEHDLRAEVVVLDGFSAHADRDELLDYAEATRREGSLRDVILVHGEPEAQRSLSAALNGRGFPTVHIPALHDVVRLGRFVRPSRARLARRAKPAAHADFAHGTADASPRAMSTRPAIRTLRVVSPDGTSRLELHVHCPVQRRASDLEVCTQCPRAISLDTVDIEGRPAIECAVDDPEGAADLTLTRVGEVLRLDTTCVSSDAVLGEVRGVAPLGGACVIDSEGALLGVIDFDRNVASPLAAFAPVTESMVRSVCIPEDATLADALHLMVRTHARSLTVTRSDGTVVGVVDDLAILRWCARHRGRCP